MKDVSDIINKSFDDDQSLWNSINESKISHSEFRNVINIIDNGIGDSVSIRGSRLIEYVLRDVICKK